MTTFLQQIINGISVGAAYATFAIGFTLIFGVNRILNLAHGAVLTWGALAGFFISKSFDAGIVVTLVSGAIAGAGVSVLLDWVAFRPLRRRKAPEFAALISSIGALMVMQNLAQRATNAKSLRFPASSLPDRGLGIGPILVTPSQLLMIVACAVFAGALVLYLRHTRFGVQIRAVAASEDTASLLGINPLAMHLQTFAISGALAGTTGVLVGLAFNNIHFTMGEPYLLSGLAIIILGGMGSVTGALLAGILMGVFQTLTIQYVSSGLSQALPFLLIIAILLLRPTGLFGGAMAESRVGRA